MIASNSLVGQFCFQGGNTALINAATAGKVDLVKSLLKDGADINQRGGVIHSFYIQTLLAQFYYWRFFVTSGR